MKVEFDKTKKRIRQASMDFACEYFKDKTEEMAIIFSKEVFKLFRQFFAIQAESNQKQEFMENAFKVINQHEIIIQELRSFIQEHLSDFLEYVEEIRSGVCTKFRYMNHGEELDPEIKEDPFAIFGLYRSQVINFPG